MNAKLIATVFSALLCSSVQAESIFSPTDGTVNFIRLLGSNSPTIGLFDDSDVSFSGDYLAVQASGSGDQVFFTPSGSDYLLTNASSLVPNALTFTGSDYFSLAAWFPLLNAWLAPDAVYCSALSASCSIFWSGLPLVKLVVDVVEVEPIIAVNPLPPSLYLFGFGALGLVIVARRRVVN